MYAVDFSKEMLDVLNAKHPPSNVTLVHTPDGYSFDIEAASIDFVIASAILHENDPGKFLREIGRILKPGGTLLIIDWRKESLRAGPPMEERLSPVQVKAFLSSNKFRPTMAKNINSRYFVVVGKRV